MSEPITIGDQTFINDPDRGWIDRKTKQPADKSLTKLLESLELKPVEKKLRVKIDRKVEPVTINGQKFVYDSNASAWIDEKTKVKAAESLQKTLNSVVKVTALAETSEEVEKAFGTIGQMAKAKVNVKTPKLPKKGKAKPSKLTASTKQPAKKATPSQLINPIIVNMVSVLASIDDSLKQQLEQKKQLDRQNAEQADEDRLENKNALDDIIKKEEHATRVKASNALLVAGGGLLLMQYFDPIMELVTGVGEVVYNMAKYTFDVMDKINEWIEWFNGTSKTATPAGSGDAGAPAPPPAKPEPPKVEPSAWSKPMVGPLKDGYKQAAKPFDWSKPPESGPLKDGYKQKPKDKPAVAVPLKPGVTPMDPSVKDLFNKPIRYLPVDKPNTSSGQGMRNDPFDKKRKYHTGIDYTGPIGTPIKASAAGYVSFARFAEKGSGYGGYGNAVVIQHKDGETQALYGHMQSINVAVGDEVKAGQVIGKMGSTGRSTGSHLHFQINKAGASGHKDGILDTAEWLRGATVSQTIPALRTTAAEGQPSTAEQIVDAAKATTTDALNPQLAMAENVAGMNAVASADTIRKSAIEKTADEVEARQPYVPPPPPPPMMPNLNAGKPNYGIKTPPAPEDKKILMNYLVYMNLLPVQSTSELTL